MAAVQEPLRNGDVANFQLGQMEQENIGIIKDEVNVSVRCKIHLIHTRIRHFVQENP